MCGRRKWGVGCGMWGVGCGVGCGVWGVGGGVWGVGCGVWAVGHGGVLVCARLYVRVDMRRWVGVVGVESLQCTCSFGCAARGVKNRLMIGISLQRTHLSQHWTLVHACWLPPSPHERAREPTHAHTRTGVDHASAAAVGGRSLPLKAHGVQPPPPSCVPGEREGGEGRRSARERREREEEVAGER